LDIINEYDFEPLSLKDIKLKVVQMQTFNVFKRRRLEVIFIDDARSMGVPLYHTLGRRA
jgi:hypothetical protein